MKNGVHYFLYSFAKPLNMYGLDIEPFFKTYTGNKIKVFNSPLQNNISFMLGKH